MVNKAQLSAGLKHVIDQVLKSSHPNINKTKKLSQKYNDSKNVKLGPVGRIATLDG